MSNYTKSTNFATKDNLSPGDPLKVVRGTEIDTEFNNISTAIATKTDNSAAAITGGSITGITDLAVADGGTGASTAAGALNNLLPSQTSAANKYLQSDGTNASWDAVTLSTADITGTLPVANGGTGVTSSTGTGNVVLSNSPTLVTPALGTPASGTATNLTGLPISTGVSGLGTGVATALAVNVGSTGAPVVNGGVLGTPSSGTLTNATGLPISTGVSGLGTGVATFLATPSSANLAAALTDETGSGANVFATSPTLVTPILGTPTSATLTNATGLPLTTGVTGTLPTANGGTNLTSFTSGGVVYASSSSALATGSTLNFNGTSLAIGDAASSADGSSLYVYGNIPASTQLGIKIGGNANSYTQQAIRFYDTYFGAYAGYIGFTTNALTFGSGTTEGLRLTSTSLYTASGINVGIGTSSPSQKLHVQSASNAQGLFKTTGAGGGSNRSSVILESPSNTWYINTNGSDLNGSDGALGFYGNSTTRMVIDTSGNLGLGVTPSAWASNQWSVFEGAYGGALAFYKASNVPVTVLTSNAYNDGGWKYKTTDPALQYEMDGNVGIHKWYNAASGTAGNPITFTQAMTLDASGNLGVGTTSISARLHVVTTAPTINTLESSAANGGYQTFSNSSTVPLYIGFGPTLVTGISTSDAAFRYSNNLVFSSGATEKMRIDSSGNLLVGTTSSSFGGRVIVSNDGTATQTSLSCINTLGSGTMRQIDFFIGTNTSRIGSIESTTSATSYNTSSDYRLKNSITPMTGALAKVALLKPVTYKWNIDGSDGQGFIAHELAEVVPDCVSGAKDAVDAKGNPEYQGIDTSFLVATLTAAIQELDAKFEAYKASHP